MTRVLSGIEPDPPLILCAMCSNPQALKVGSFEIPAFTIYKILQNIYQPKSCNIGLTPQPTSEGRSKIYYTNSEDDCLNKESKFLNRVSLTGIQRDKYFQRIVDPRGKNFQKNKRSKSARYCMVVIGAFIVTETWVISKLNTRISKHKILILEHLIPLLIRKVARREIFSSENSYLFILFTEKQILEKSFKTDFLVGLSESNSTLTAIPRFLFTNFNTNVMSTLIISEKVKINEKVQLHCHGVLPPDYNNNFTNFRIRYIGPLPESLLAVKILK
ncbi:hypothetical protein H8356DRAFT_1345437 [Neocallimastix lanati (nom. inval.)]|nr:hypothetical protein H8356DRAFT_1345437 [Neocallimastix sp. JGI-2020a]